MTQSEAYAKEGGISPATGRWVLLSTILASSMAFIDGSALNVALPALQDDLNASGTQLLAIVNGYLVMLASLMLVGGSLGDRYGRKRVFMTGIAIFATASLVCGLSPTASILIGARVVQGIGCALMVPGSLAIISALFGDEGRGQAIGIWSSASAITTAGGPLIGGLLASAGLWRGVFFINLPLAVISLAVLYFKIPENKDEEVKGRLDYLGALLITLSLAGITIGFISAGERGFSSPIVFVPLAIGILAMGGFIYTERRVKNPMLPLSIFKSSTFSGANLITLFLYAALSALFFFLPLNLIQVQGYGETVAALAILPTTVLLAGLSPWAGRLSSRVGARLPLTIGPALAGLGCFLLIFTGVSDGPSDYWLTFFPGITFFGLGMGITVAPLTNAALSAAPEGLSGIASGVNNAIARSAGALAIAIMGGIALVAFSTALEERTEDISLSETARTELQNEAENLGNAEPPDRLSEDVEEEVQQSINLAFVDAFRLVVGFCAALALTSAVVGFLVVEGEATRATEEESPPAQETEDVDGA
jgi:EmrB/QacA subfamily drug resistance transporter